MEMIEIELNQYVKLFLAPSDISTIHVQKDL